MVFNATVNKISVILWKSVLLMEETGVPGENHPPVASQNAKTPTHMKIQTDYWWYIV
jgi:hypothetical protein